MPAIVVAESDPALRAMIAQVLQPFGYTIEWANSVREAHGILSTCDCCLIVANLELSDGSSGLNLWNHCQPCAEPPPFVLVLREPDRLFLGLVDIGVECPPFFSVPFAVDAFRNTVRELLDEPSEDLADLSRGDSLAQAA